VLPLKDNIPTRSIPLVTVGLIIANVVVWVGYELPDLEASVNAFAYHPCEVENTCRQVGHDWPVTIFTSMFMHGSWSHLIGNMLFLWIFGNNIEDGLGRARFIVFYVAAGLAATALQTFVTVEFGSARDAAVPNLGASGAIAGVLGAYILLHPHGRVLTWIVPIFFLEIPAFVYLGIWFLFQLFDGGYAFVRPQEGGGIAYFAHIGGFVFGFLAVKLFAAGRGRRPAPLYR
jgi:membrane associated rhomboid family serine protease